MEEREKQEEKNKRIGWLTSVGVQLVLLILFYFIVAWREPFPPIPEYGIELGFTTSAGASSSPAPTQPNEATEPVEEETTEESSDEVEVEEEAVESQDETLTEVQEIEDVPVAQEEASATSKPVEEKKVDDRAVMKPSETETTEENTDASDGKEDEKEIDQRAIYGSQGTSTGANEGASLALAGWIWDFKPKPNDTSDQSGKIVYKIIVDQDGYLVKIETVTSTVSPAIERKYREAVQKLTFSKTADYKTAPLSTGTITFIIKSK